MEVWTDGTIKAVEAIQEAAENLVNHFFLFSNLNRVADEGVERTPLVVSPEIYQTPIEKLDLSPRTLNCLKRSHISKVGEVLELSDDDLLKIRNFGEKSLVELREKLSEHGVGDSFESNAGSIGEISPEDLGELMGDDLDDSGSTADIPAGMSVEDSSQSVEADSEGEYYDDDGEDD